MSLQTTRAQSHPPSPHHTHALARSTPLPPLTQILHTQGDWKQLQEYVLLLSKRRSQLRQAVQVCV